MLSYPLGDDANPRSSTCLSLGNGASSEPSLQPRGISPGVGVTLLVPQRAVASSPLAPRGDSLLAGEMGRRLLGGPWGLQLGDSSRVPARHKGAGLALEFVSVLLFCCQIE